MSGFTLARFADRVGRMMPALAREFLRNQTIEFYKVKLTLPQCVILDMLDKNDELNMSDLAKSLNVTTAAMTGVVDRLVRDGHVIRISDPDDRRVIKIGLTVKGNKCVKMIHDQRRKTTIKLFSVLSPAERQDYLRLLTKITDGIKG